MESNDPSEAVVPTGSENGAVSNTTTEEDRPTTATEEVIARDHEASPAEEIEEDTGRRLKRKRKHGDRSHRNDMLDPEDLALIVENTSGVLPQEVLEKLERVRSQQEASGREGGRVDAAAAGTAGNVSADGPVRAKRLKKAKPTTEGDDLLSEEEDSHAGKRQDTDSAGTFENGDIDSASNQDRSLRPAGRSKTLKKARSANTEVAVVDEDDVDDVLAAADMDFDVMSGAEDEVSAPKTFEKSKSESRRKEKAARREKRVKLPKAVEEDWGDIPAASTVEQDMFDSDEEDIVDADDASPARPRPTPAEQRATRTDSLGERARTTEDEVDEEIRRGLVPSGDRDEGEHDSLLDELHVGEDEDEEENELGDFLVDDEGRPERRRSRGRRTQRPVLGTGMYSGATRSQLHEAMEIFGSLDFLTGGESDATKATDGDYTGVDDPLAQESTESVATAPVILPIAPKNLTDTLLRRYEPSVLLEEYATPVDDIVRNLDLPERLLRRIYGNSATLKDSALSLLRNYRRPVTTDELREETEWILSRLVQMRDAIHGGAPRPLPVHERELAVAIAAVIEFTRSEREPLDPGAVYHFRKDLVYPALVEGTELNVWVVSELDERWSELRRRREVMQNTLAENAITRPLISLVPRCRSDAELSDLSNYASILLGDEAEKVNGSATGGVSMRRRNKNELIAVLKSHGIDRFADMFAVKTLDFGRNVADGARVVQPPTPEFSPEELAHHWLVGIQTRYQDSVREDASAGLFAPSQNTTFLAGVLTQYGNDTTKVLKAARQFLSHEIGHEPRIRREVRTIRGGCLHTRPRAAARVNLEPSDPLYFVRRLVSKPIIEFRSDAVSYLKVLKAESRGLIEVILEITAEDTDDMVAQFSEMYLADDNTVANSPHEAAWNEQRKLVLQDTVEKFLVPELKKEVRAKLLRDGTDRALWEIEVRVREVCLSTNFGTLLAMSTSPNRAAGDLPWGNGTGINISLLAMKNMGNGLLLPTLDKVRAMWADNLRTIEQERALVRDERRSASTGTAAVIKSLNNLSKRFQQALKDSLDAVRTSAIFVAFVMENQSCAFVALDSEGEVVDRLRVELLHILLHPNSEAKIRKRATNAKKRVIDWLDNLCPVAVVMGVPNGPSLAQNVRAEVDQILQSRAATTATSNKTLADEIGKYMTEFSSNLRRNATMRDDRGDVPLWERPEALEHSLMRNRMCRDVSLIRMDAARVFVGCPSARSEFPEWVENGTEGRAFLQAVGVGRSWLNTIAFLCSLKSRKGEAYSAIPWHPLQDILPTEAVRNVVERTLSSLVAMTGGVDINRLNRHRWVQSTLSFIPGLGPSKAQHLIRALASYASGEVVSRAELNSLLTIPQAEDPTLLASAVSGGQKSQNADGVVVEDDFLADYSRDLVFVDNARKRTASKCVLRSCVPFLRISPTHLSDSIHPTSVNILDSCCLHPEDYGFARKMAEDALEIRSSDQDWSSTVADLVSKPEVWEEIDLDTFAREWERTGKGKKRLALYDIKAQLLLTFVHRYPYALAYVLPSVREPLALLIECDDVPKESLVSAHLALKQIRTATNNAGTWAQLIPVPEGIPAPAELIPFAPYSIHIPTLSKEEWFDVVSGETADSFRIGMLVSCVVLRIQPELVTVELQNGLRGTITRPQLSDNPPRHCGDVVSVKQPLQARLVKIDRPNLRIELTCRGSDLKNKRMDVAFQRAERYFVDEDESATMSGYGGGSTGSFTGTGTPFLSSTPSGVGNLGSRTPQTANMMNRFGNMTPQYGGGGITPRYGTIPATAGGSTGSKGRPAYLGRTIEHPQFMAVGSREAEQKLESAEPGADTAVIRPSSKGSDHLTITWKFADDVYVHTDVLEKDRAPGRSVGSKLSVEDEDYEDLDEILYRYVEPQTKYAKLMCTHRRFVEGGQSDQDQRLASLRSERPDSIPYVFAVCHTLPRRFELRYVPKTATVMEYITVTPHGYRFRSQYFGDPEELLKWFKLHWMERSAGATPSTLRPGATPQAAGLVAAMTPQMSRGGMVPAGYGSNSRITPQMTSSTPMLPPLMSHLTTPVSRMPLSTPVVGGMAVSGSTPAIGGSGQASAAPSKYPTVDSMYRVSSATPRLPMM